jgi:hypothetical protein
MNPSGGKQDSHGAADNGTCATVSRDIPHNDPPARRLSLAGDREDDSEA